MGGRGGDQLGLMLFALTRFGEAGRENNCAAAAERPGLLDHGRYMLSGDRDDHCIRRFRQIGQRSETVEAMDLVAPWINGIDLAAVIDPLEVQQRLATVRCRAFACADDGDRLRVQKSAEIH